MKLLRKLFFPLMAGSLLMSGLQAMDSSMLKQADISISVKELLSKVSKHNLAGLAKNAAIIGIVDTASAGIAQIVGDSYGKTSGELAACAANLLVLMNLKFFESVKKGELSLKAVKTILPIDTIMNADGFLSKPLVTSLLSVAGLACVHHDQLGVSPAVISGAIIALKLMLFNNNKEALVYNMSTHLLNLIPSKDLLVRAWAAVAKK